MLSPETATEPPRPTEVFSDLVTAVDPPVVVEGVSEYVTVSVDQTVDEASKLLVSISPVVMSELSVLAFVEYVRLLEIVFA